MDAAGFVADPNSEQVLSLSTDDDVQLALMR